MRICKALGSGDLGRIQRRESSPYLPIAENLGRVLREGFQAIFNDVDACKCRICRLLSVTTGNDDEAYGGRVYCHIFG